MDSPATTDKMLADLHTLLAHAERRLKNARPRDVAGPQADPRIAGQKRVDNLKAAIARVEARR